MDNIGMNNFHQKALFMAVLISAVMLAGSALLWKLDVDRAGAAGGCTASLIWTDKNGNSVSSVNPGDSATETWAISFDNSVTGATNTVGSCTGLAEHGISAGPQSYTFSSIAFSGNPPSFSCTVRGLINGTEACVATGKLTPPATTANPPVNSGNSSGVQGTLSFSPATVKDGQPFNISLIGGSANTQTRLWVDNGDGNGFQNFGLWVNTAADGSLNLSRSLNCNAYTSLVPGQMVTVGNKQLVQKVYVEYVGTGLKSSVATQTKDCTGTQNTPGPQSGGNTPTISADGERCYFNVPQAKVGGFAAWDAEQQPIKTAFIDANVCSNTSSSDPAFIAANCAGDLKWSGMRSIGGQIAVTDQHLDPSQYSVVLNGGSYVNQSFSLSDSVRLKRDELVQNNTYNLRLIKKSTGAAVAQCSVNIQAQFGIYGGGGGGSGTLTPGGPVGVQPGVFPADGSYALDSTAGQLAADYKFAPQIGAIATPIPNFTYQGGDSMSIFLGQNYDNIYFILGHEPGVVGAWGLTDPFDFVAGQPGYQCLGVGLGICRNGPIQFHWPHKSHGFSGVVGEGDSGAIVLDKDGLQPGYPWYFVQTGTDANGYPIWSNPDIHNGPTGMSAVSFSGAAPSFGQQIDAESGASGGVPLAVYATPDGNYFGYVQSFDKKKVSILDMSGLTNTADPSYLKAAASINWPDLEDFRVTNIPGSDTQFALGLVGKNLKIGRIDNSSGKVVDIKTFPVTRSIVSYIGNQSVLPVPANGATYVFIVEKADQKAGNLTIGEYLMGSSGQSLVRKGSITVNGYSDGNGEGAYGFVIKIIPSKSGNGYPFLAAGTASKGGDANHASSGDILFYNLKDLLQNGGNISPKPDFAVPNPAPTNMDKGEIILNTASAQGFWDESGGKDYLYLYRAAYQWNQLVHSDSMFQGYLFSTSTSQPAIRLLYSAPWLLGNPTVRADRIDVTSLVAGATTPTTPNPTTTTNTGNPPPSTIGSGGDCYAKYKDNIQLVDLCQQIESLKQQVCQMSPAVSFCSSPQAQ